MRKQSVSVVCSKSGIAGSIKSVVISENSGDEKESAVKTVADKIINVTGIVIKYPINEMIIPITIEIPSPRSVS